MLECCLVSAQSNWMDDDANLEGKFLVAMPGMGDPRFEQSVIYMCAHSDGGAMGLIVNKRLPDVSFDELAGQLNVDLTGGGSGSPIYYGGPVEHGRGFVLHSAEFRIKDSTLRVSDDVSMTGTVEIINAIAKGEGPQKHLLALGYSGWSPNQLEAEIRSNGWLVLEAGTDFIFNEAPDDIWDKAFEVLGVDRRLLSGAAGEA